MNLKRRDFLRMTGGVVGGAALLGCGSPQGDSSASEPLDVRRVLGQVHGFSQGVTEFSHLQLAVIRDERGFGAVRALCTHQRCGIVWGGGSAAGGKEPGFFCPCHGSEFRPDGTVRKGPARRALEWVALAIEGDDLVAYPAKRVGAEERVGG